MFKIFFCADREVEYEVMTDSDKKFYKEFNAANRVSIRAKLAEMQHFKIENNSKPLFEKNVFEFFFSADREVENVFMVDFDRKLCKESNAANCVSIGAKCIEIQYFKVENNE